MSPKTEREKMLAGERYNCLHPDLKAERETIKTLLRRYNRSETGAERRTLLERLLGRVGQGAISEPPFYCSYGKNMTLGDHVYLNFLCTILDNSEVRIGHHAMIGPGVQIYTAAHPLRADDRNEGWEVAKPVAIEDNVWIGGSAILLPGVTIGRNAVVGAGAVVTRSVPPDTVVAGNPARIIRRIEPDSRPRS